MIKLLPTVLFCSFLLVPFAVQAATGCTLVISYPDGKTLHQDGDCQQRRSPASSFKIPLALMGFDSGILTDEHNPALPYKDEYKAGRESDKKTVDPTIWEKDSVVWYSQQITQKLGMEKFQQYIDRIDYGNRDLSGTPGKSDGLTKAWLFTSLSISPVEQTDFIRKLLNHDLGVSAQAYDKTLAIIPRFSAGDGWAVFGKTGSGWLLDEAGKSDKTKPLGWFVGWAEKGNQKAIFAKLMIDDKANAEYGGPRAREEFLAELPTLLPVK